MKNGLILENNELIYYKNGEPKHAGVIKVDGNIYYIGRGGRAVKGRHVVHKSMSNDILKRGTYKFGEDYKLIEGSYIAPQKQSHKSKRKKKGNNNPWKKKFSIRPFYPLIGIVVAFSILIGLAIVVETVTDAYKDKEDKTAITSTTIYIPKFNEEVLLCSDAAKMLYDGEISVATAAKAGSYYRPFVFEYNVADKGGILLLSENSNLSNAKEYILEIGKTKLTIDNLKTGTEYFYKATVNGENYTGSFKTAKSNRFLSIPNLQNTRDIGGYTTVDGKTVKQGMIIRGTELDGLVVPSYILDNDYIKYVQSEFGFVCDFDLREPTVYSGNYKSRLGEGVTHKFYSSPMYGGAFHSTNREFLRQIFSDLAKPENYPMYLHCTHGADRTGTIVFLLQGILNMSEKDMLCEYHLTDGYAEINNIDTLIIGFENVSGNTIQEKIANYLVSTVGVTEAEIESIRNILLEK